MIRALAGRHLYHQRWLLAALVAGVFGMEVLLVLIAQSFTQGPGLEQLLTALPGPLRAFIQGQIGELSFAAFVAFGFQHPAVLTMTLAYVVLAATVPAAERESGLLDLFLARPVPRSRYLLAVLTGVVLGASVLPLAQLGGAALGLALVEVADEPSWTRYVGSALGQALLLLAWGGVALFFATGAARRGPAVARVLGAILVLYVVEAFAGMYAPLRTVRWASPFHWFQPTEAGARSGGTVGTGLLATLAAVSIALAFVRFQRRDV